MDAREHHRLCLFGALVRLRPQLPDPEGWLDGYWRQLDAHPAGRDLAAWRAALERADRPGLPLVRLRALVGHDGLELLLAAGLVEEDQRFAELFAALQDDPARRRPSVGLLAALAGGEDPVGTLGRLAALGLLVADDPSPGTPGPDRVLRPADGVWALARGDDDPRLAPAVDPADLVVAPEVRARLERLDPAALGAVVVRGPATTGRRTLLATLAHRLGRRVLRVEALHPGVGALATLAHAVPVVALDPAPGEAVAIPELPGLDGLLGVALPDHGGLEGLPDAVVLHLGLPSAAERAAHWRAALGPGAAEPDGLRLTGGHIRRVARAAHAAAGGPPTDDDLRDAARELQARLFDTHCERVATAAGLDAVAVEPAVREELELLVARCRHRERLLAEAAAPVAGSGGVRALLAGPSGTGKTLAARAVAGELRTDLHRLDLARIVDKYIGETEKHLAAVLDRAEQAGVVLLLDEGDALLAKRTAVASSNDRYANVETSYLLARLETFRGILLVTTNAADRIDPAFRRRMDLVVTFPAPAAPARHRIWAAHLPAGHRVGDDDLEELAAACALTGGQIRTAAEHATLLALTNGGTVTGDHLLTAVRREFRKAGQVCPLD